MEPAAGAANWSSGFLPVRIRVFRFGPTGDPILNVANPPGFDRRLQRDSSLDLDPHLNEKRLGAVGDPEIVTRIAAYEMAYRMQTSASLN